MIQLPPAGKPSMPMQKGSPPSSFEAVGFCSSSSCFGSCSTLLALMRRHVRSALVKHRLPPRLPHIRPRLGVTSSLGGCRLSATWWGHQGHRSKGERRLYFCPCHAACVTTQVVTAPLKEGTGALQRVLNAGVPKGRLDTRRKEPDEKKKGACVEGSYLVSPAHLRVCTSLCSQNIIFISVPTRQFLKRESKKQWWTLRS